MAVKTPPLTTSHNHRNRLRRACSSISVLTIVAALTVAVSTPAHGSGDDPWVAVAKSEGAELTLSEPANAEALIDSEGNIAAPSYTNRRSLSNISIAGDSDITLHYRVDTEGV